MGRQPWTSRLTVEECPIQVCATSFHRAGVFECSPGRLCIISWQSNQDGAVLGSLKCEMSAYGPGGRAIFIPPQVFNFGETPCSAGGQTIPLSATRPHFGGGRFWFLCGCGRRSGKMYLPAGQTAFRCRPCYDLTYQSAQQHSKRWDKLRPIFEGLASVFERA